MSDADLREQLLLILGDQDTARVLAIVQPRIDGVLADRREWIAKAEELFDRATDAASTLYRVRTLHAAKRCQQCINVDQYGACETIRALSAAPHA